MGNGTGSKLAWAGEVIAVQPRIRLWRSFDERSHTYLGYTLRVRGVVGYPSIPCAAALRDWGRTKAEVLDPYFG